jgi:thioesterase domain-containing protein
MNKDTFLEYIHSQIPITAAMGIDLIDWDEKGIVVTAPLKPNINHQKTAFGGSINTLCTVAGWSRVYFLLDQANIKDAHIVIQKSEIEYLLPAKEAFTAHVKVLDAEAEHAFLEQYEQKKKARLKLAVECFSDEKCVARFTGSYVIYT